MRRWRVSARLGDYIEIYNSLCPRSPAEVSARVDALIENIKELQSPHMNDSEPKDIVLVAHGHLTRAFAKRWLGFEIGVSLRLMMQPSGVCTLSYDHHNIDEPALVMGVGFSS
jgi:probable phosphoglycerate mutase